MNDTTQSQPIEGASPLDRLVEPGPRHGRADDVVTLLRSHIERSGLRPGDRLAPERRLCEALGVTRARLRRALRVLEDEGRLWRHVGRGTFVGRRELADAGAGPAEVLDARLSLEPELARLAAARARPVDLAAVDRALEALREARDHAGYERAERRLHEAIARAGGNGVLMSLFRSLAGRWRAAAPVAVARRPPGPDHPGVAEHEVVVAAIRARDACAAVRAMRAHLARVRADLFGDACP